jgi:pimeloyl-ACP methyl ester carboxylesterase
VRQDFVHADGLAVYTRSFGAPDAGSRPAVVLVHGFLVSGRYMLRSAEILSRHVDVFVLDLPGHGKSSKPPHALTVPEYAGILANWARTLGLPPAVYLGHSFGCQIVAALAVGHPDVVTAAILAGPTVDPDMDSAPHLAIRLALDFLHERPSLVPTELRDLWDMGLKYLLGELPSMLHDRIEERLPFIRQPVLVVRGSLDPIAPASWLDRAAYLTPHAATREVPHAPHAANYSTPERFVEAILPFLLEHSRV